MLKNINLIWITGILLTFYLMQGFLYSSGSIISQCVLFLIIAVGVISFVKTLLHRSKPFASVIFALFFVMLLFTYILSPKTQYGWQYEAIGYVSTLAQFKNACVFSLLYFVGYYSEIRHSVSSRTISGIFIMLLLSSVIMFVYLENSLLVDLEVDAITNNAAYKFVALIPFLPIVFSYLRNKYIRVIITILIGLFIVMGSKRGAILCMLVSIVFSLYYYLRHTKLTGKKIFSIIFILLIGGAVFFYSVSRNEYLVGRLENTEESGIGTREIAYSVLWEHWYSDSSTVAFYLGNGSSATISVWGNYAHNDWLELLVNNGLLGGMIYLLLFLSFFVITFRSSLPFEYRLSMYLCLLIWFMKTCFSMGYTDLGNGVFTMLLGILTGKDVVMQHINNKKS